MRQKCDQRRGAWRQAVVLTNTLLLCWSVAASAAAQDSADKNRAGNSKVDAPAQKDGDARGESRQLDGKKSDRQSDLDEQLVLDFVGKHQPKMLELITYLKPQAEQYQRALREMNRAMQRLQSLNNRDTELYQIELELWQIRSKQQLVAAEVLASKGDVTKATAQKRLQSLVKKEVQKVRERIELQRNRAQRQVEKLSAQLEDRILHEDELVRKAFENWQSRLAKQARNQKNRSKNLERQSKQRNDANGGSSQEAKSGK